MSSNYKTTGSHWLTGNFVQIFAEKQWQIRRKCGICRNCWIKFKLIYANFIVKNKPYNDWLKVFDVGRDWHISQRPLFSVCTNFWLMPIFWRINTQPAKCDFTALVQVKLDKCDECTISDGLLAFTSSSVAFAFLKKIKFLPPP
jgi:hypothetical protein